VSEGRKREFQAFGWAPEDIPDPQDPATFQRSKLDWSEMMRHPHRDILDWYRSLIALRRSLPALSDGCFGAVSVRFDEDRSWLVMSRGPAVLAANLAAEAQNLPLPFAARLRLSSDASCRVAETDVHLTAESVAILEAC
jgi:maltooligosyltrehalose trehalohydrolase